MRRTEMRRFVLNRIEDESNVSGTGLVCEGVRFTNGTVALTWFGSLSSHVIYKRMGDVEAIHGHDGKTIIEWLDPEIIQ